MTEIKTRLENIFLVIFQTSEKTYFYSSLVWNTECVWRGQGGGGEGLHGFILP